MRMWLKKAGVRAIKTVAQALAAMIGTAAMVQEVDWKMVTGAAALAGILSLLTSLAGLPELGQGDDCNDSECLYDETEEENL